MFSAKTLTCFFTNGPQMALSMDTHSHMDQEVMVKVEDFENFRSDQMDKSINKLCMSIPGIPDQVDPNGAVLVPEVLPISPCVLSVKCNMSLSVASQELH